MIDIAEEVKELYRTDYIPYRDKTVKKELRLHFPELNLTITNENIYTESMKLEESLCSESELVFGGCEAAKFEIAAAGVTEELIGKQMIVTQRIADTYDVPFGTYIVDSVVKKDDLIFKDITAYDHMLKADIDVSEWYNSLTFPIKLKEFRLNLCQQLRFSTTEQILPNDDTYIKKTVEPSYLKGRDVLRAIGEINAAFGHFTRDNKFKFIGIGAIGLYPSETLYPEEDLFPSECTEYMASASYKSIQYEDYMVEAIDSVQIRQEEGDTGGVAGKTTNNPYIVQGNFLTFGMDSTMLQAMADSMLLHVRNKRYRPHNTQIIGLPYLEVGDTIAIATSSDTMESFIFNRTLSGIQSLTDKISAEGNQTRKNEVTRSTEIEQLKGKTLKIIKSVEIFSTELSDLEAETNSKFEQTTEHITTEVNNLKEETSSQITQTLNTIVLKVDNNGTIVKVELGSDAKLGSSFKISADNINLDGYVTISALSGDGTTEINGKNITTGYIMSRNYLVRDSEGKIIYNPQGNATETGEGTLINLDNGYGKYAGKFNYAWLDEEESENLASVELKEGFMRIWNAAKNRSLYATAEGIATTPDANNATGVIDFFSKIYGQSKAGTDYKGITVQTNNSPIGLRSLGNHIFIEPEISQADGNMFDFNVSSQSKYGTISWGSGTYTEEDVREYASQLRFSPDVENPFLRVTDKENNLAPLYASNLPEGINSISISDVEFSVATKTKGETYTLTKDSSGRITKMTDSEGNAVKIAWE